MRNKKIMPMDGMWTPMRGKLATHETIVGRKEFKAIVVDNPTATGFKTMLPLTINMTELNGNEKYFDLSGNLPTKCLKSRKNQHGRPSSLWIKDTGLADALGSGNIVVTIKLQ